MAILNKLSYYYRQYHSSIKLVIGLIVVVLIGAYLYQNQSVFVNLQNLTIAQILLISVINFSAMLAYAKMNQTLIAKLGTETSFSDNLLLQFNNSLLNKLIPNGGSIFRAMYLKKQYHFSFSYFVSTLAGLYIIGFATYSIIGLICFAIIYLQFQLYSWWAIIAMVSMLAVTLVIILISPKLPDTNYIFSTINQVSHGWSKIKHDKKFITQLTGITSLILFINAYNLQLMYRSLGYSIEYIRALYLSVISLITIFINITPEAIGIKEALFAYSATIINIPPEVLVLGSVTLRAIALVTTAIFGSLSYFVLLKRLK